MIFAARCRESRWADLVPLALTCRHLCSETMPVLFRKISVQITRHHQLQDEVQRLTTLLERAEANKYVREVQVEGVMLALNAQTCHSSDYDFEL